MAGSSPAMTMNASEYQQGRAELMRYAVIYERTRTGYSAYVPDLPGCVAAAKTLEDTESLMEGAIAMHIAGLREDGEEVPVPTTVAKYISAA